MAEIEVHFTEQFDGEVVAISGGGRELFRSAPLKTDMRKGIAQIARVSVPDGKITLSFDVVASGTGIAGTTAQIAKPKFVTVTLLDRKLTATAVSEDDYRREPRGYA